MTEPSVSQRDLLQALPDRMGVFLEASLEPLGMELVEMGLAAKSRPYPMFDRVAKKLYVRHEFKRTAKGRKFAGESK